MICNRTVVSYKAMDEDSSYMTYGQILGLSKLFITKMKQQLQTRELRDDILELERLIFTCDYMTMGELLAPLENKYPFLLEK